MRHLFLSVPTLGTILFFTFLSVVQATTPPLLLSEVSIAGEKSSDEYIEIYNGSDTSIDLAGMQLRRKTESGSESSIKVFSAHSIIPAHGFFLWANSQGIFGVPFADTETSSSALASNNSIGLLSKSSSDGILIDSLSWGNGALFIPTDTALPNPAKNTALVRNSTTLMWSNENILTPTNSRGEIWAPPTPDPPPLPPTTPSIRFNEVFANPKGDEADGEFIEFYNSGTSDALLDGLHIKDASKTGDYAFPVDTRLPSQGYFLLKRSASKISLNNSNETLILTGASGVIIDSMNYTKTKEGISLNYTSAGWRGGPPTPGAPNQFNIPPETKERVPKKGYRGVPITVNARGEDADGDTLKYTWDFGDDHKSYKRETTHTYQENGIYTITLTTTDGSDDVIETFSLKIEPFPKTNVRISSFMPNPTGNDNENEWLIIENRGKKPVDLKGYSIATGWKNLVNHPIRESFIIKPKSEAKLTRAFSLFTLPNQKGKIELRSPDGETIQDIKYKLEKSIPDNAVYTKEKGKRWAWHEANQIPASTTASSDAVVTNEAEEELLESTPANPLPQGEIVPKETLGAEEVLGVSTTEAITAQEQPYLKLLNYGTAVTLPENLVLTFSEKESPLPQTREHYALSFAKEMLSDINTTINQWQNKK